MAGVSLSSLIPNSRVNLSTEFAVGEVSRFNNYVFMGMVAYPVARSIPQNDIPALVAQTRPYFRPSSLKDETLIQYVLLKLSETSPIVVIPEPLVQLDTVAVAQKISFQINVRDQTTQEQLQQVLAGNGYKDFTVTVVQSAN